VSSDPVDPVAVFCVDDNACFREVLRELVASTPGFTQVGEASGGEETLSAVAFLRPHIVLMDVRMPGLDGFDTAGILTARRRDLLVILVSAGPIGPPDGLVPRSGQVALVNKRDLCPRVLLDIWHALGTR
jgi:CheY-like chemotaxis protein